MVLFVVLRDGTGQLLERAVSRRERGADDVFLSPEGGEYIYIYVCVHGGPSCVLSNGALA